jgi:iron(III) transport system ATP-binding protein
VAGNVAFGLPRAERRDRTRLAELLALVGLSGFEHRRPGELSGGQQQRVALARALAPRPQLVLLDEPFSALDAGLREAVRADVRQALRRAGASAVLVTHDQDEALSMADSVAVMDGGRILMHDAPQRVYASPADLTVARFVGQLVELEATLDHGWVETVLGRVPVEAVADTPDGRRIDRGPGLLTLRPEQLLVLAAEAGDGVPGRVVATSYYGHDTTVTVRIGDDGGTPAVTVVGRTTQQAPPGPLVRVTVRGAGRFFPR